MLRAAIRGGTTNISRMLGATAWTMNVPPIIATGERQADEPGD